MLDLQGFGTCLIGVGTIVTAINTTRVRRNLKMSNGHTLAGVVEAIHTEVVSADDAPTLAEAVEAIHTEVATANGIPVGEMLERQEGRRIKDIPVDDRTDSEQGYADRLDEGGRNRGHEHDNDESEQP